MRQHGLALFVRPHNAQRARLLPPRRQTPPATSPTLPPPPRVAAVQVRGGDERRGHREREQTMFDKATYVLAVVRGVNINYNDTARRFARRARLKSKRRELSNRDGAQALNIAGNVCKRNETVSTITRF